MKNNRAPKFCIGDVIYDDTWNNPVVVVGNVKMNSGNYLVALEPLNNRDPFFYVVDCTLRAYRVFVGNPDDLQGGTDYIGVYHSIDL